MIITVSPRFTIKKKEDKFELYAYYNKTAIGFCVIYERTDFVRIEEFVVYERYRRQGIGRGIIDHILKYFKKDICLCCYKENDANKFYRKLGFKSDGEDVEFYHYIKEVGTQ